MRIRSFSPQRYGRFTDFTLNFSDAPDFHIVLGPNEAGKSTILHGLRDLLYGIDARSPYNFLHDYADMRLIAEIDDGHGETRCFQRRKGNKNTLLDADGRPLPDSALAQLLGPTDRDFFETMFGLDHEGLRSGGDALLRTDGEAADSLFGSASGLASILSVSNAFEQHADDLFTARRSKSKPFYAAQDRRKEALAALRDSTVTAADWESLEREIAGLAEQHAALEAEIKQQRAIHGRANRALRVRPIITKLRESRQRLLDLGDLPDIDLASIDLGRDALKQKTDAQADRRRIDADRERLERQIAELHVSDALLALQDDVARQTDLRGRIVAARQDTPRREQAIESAQLRITTLLADLGFSVAPKDAASVLPPKAIHAQIRTLITNDAQLTTSEKAARGEAQRTERALDSTRADLADLADLPDIDELGPNLAAVLTKGDLEQQRLDAGVLHSEAARALGLALAQLPLWTSDAAALSTVPVPIPETLTRFEDAFAESTQNLDRIREQLTAAFKELAAIEEEEQALATAGDVPTRDAIAAARQHRDAGWTLVRGSYVNQPPTVDAAQIESFAAADSLPDAFESAVEAADHLADRKEAEAARVATAETLRRRGEHANRQQDEHQRAEQQARQARERLEADWTGTWQPTGISPLSPREMIGWNTQRERVLTLLRDERRAATALQRLVDDVRAATNSLRTALGLAASQDATLAALIANANGVIDKHRNAAALRAQLEQSETDLKSEHAERQRLVNDAESERSDWRDAWAAAMTAVGQSPDQRPDATAAVLELFEQLDAALRELDADRGRLNAMRRDESTFAAAITELQQRLQLETQETEPLGVYDHFAAALQEMKTTAARRATLLDQLEPVTQGLDAAVVSHDAAELTLADLRRQAAADSDAALADVYTRAEQSADLLAHIDGLESDLQETGDGLLLDDLIREADTSDPEGDRSAIEIADAHLDRIRDAFLDLGAQRSEREAQRSVIQTGGDTEQHAESLEHARAELRDVSERYALQHAAAYLLSRAIDIVREERQGPILAAASDLFATITDRSFEKLVIDFDQGDRPILNGARPSGERVNVSAMSDGTRDQLFLSLRLALVQRYVADAPPLPFIADDLLVNFDDERATQALQALARLSKDTQIIFFTHHEHLVELAKTSLNDGDVMLHEIGPG